MPEAHLKDLVQSCRKELKEDELLTSFDKDTILAQLDQFIVTRTIGELLYWLDRTKVIKDNEITRGGGWYEIIPIGDSGTGETETR